MKTATQSPKGKRDSKKRVASTKGAPKKAHPRSHQPGQRFVGERRIVLFDLDGTLMDSGTAWRECSERALAQLAKLLPDLDSKTVFAAYRAIYACHAHIRGKPGPRGHTFEDMRQEWNTRTSYALLLAWSRSADFPRGSISQYQNVLQNLLKNDDQMERLFDDAEEFRDTWSIDWAPYIDRAVEEFWNVDFRQRYLYPGVPELLYSLRRRNIEYYIATEGHLPTQWRKIRALGLDQPNPYDPENLPWISPNQLLTTSQAARPHRALQALIGLSEWYRGRAAASKDALNMLTTSAYDHSQLQLTADSSEIMASGLARMAGFFRRLAGKISIDASGLVQPEFYTRVLLAISQAPDNPRGHFAGTEFSASWNTPIRLAMVGDKHSSDIAPVLRLASELKTRIMAIWVRQGSHGSGEPDPGKTPEWVECSAISEAGAKYLLREEAWPRLTERIDKPPARLFFSAIEPLPGEHLEKNIWELLAGIGTVRNSLAKNQQIGPNLKIVRTATRVVNDLFGIIVSDIRLSKIRDDVIRFLLRLCLHPELRSKDVVLGQCAGLPEAAVELLLAICEESEGTPAAMGAYREYLKIMANLLDTNHLEWAAAVIDVLDSKAKIVDDICSSQKLARLYSGRLMPLLHFPHLPDNFPRLKTELLYGRILDHVDFMDEAEQPPYKTTLKEKIILGQSSQEHRHQQFVFLGTNREEDQVYCSLGGPKRRNIVCVCGSPGTGKSSSLDALVLGALKGEGLEAASAPQSAVIVFHHQLSGACPFAIPAQQLGFVTKVFSFVDELPDIKKEYPTLSTDQINPIRFDLDQLSDDLVLRWIGLGEGTAAAQEFRRIRRDGGIKTTLGELRNAIATAPQDVVKKKKEILRSLDKLEPIITKKGELPLSKEIDVGRLIIIDCGRVNQHFGRLDAWETVLSVLEKHWDSRKEGEHLLLVFDELHQVAGRHANSDAKLLASRLGGLVDRMGRHQQVSIVAASQRPNDFKGAGDLWEAATVLLIHRLQTPVKEVPSGELWDLARNVGDFTDLKVGQAWYCSGEQDEREPSRKITGYVKVRRTS